MRISNEEDLLRSIVLGTTAETVELEFKKDLDGYSALNKEGKQLGMVEFARDISAIANTRGGCLAIGVDERREQRASIAVAFNPFTDAEVDARIAWMNDAIKNYCVPWTFSSEMRRVGVPGGGKIIAVNVEPSVRAILVWHNERMECLVRNDHGKARLNPDELVRRIMETSRAAYLELREVVTSDRKQDRIDAVPGVYTWHPQAGYQPVETNVFLRVFAEDHIELCLPDHKNKCVIVPMAYIKAAWRTSDNRIGIGLDVRIVITAGSSLRLEPF